MDMISEGIAEGEIAIFLLSTLAETSVTVINFVFFLLSLVWP
jgi:hypothetical protein